MCIRDWISDGFASDLRILAQEIVRAYGDRIAQERELDVPLEIVARLFWNAALEILDRDVLVAQPLEVGAFQAVGRPARLVLSRDELQLGVPLEDAAEDLVLPPLHDASVLEMRLARFTPHATLDRAGLLFPPQARAV